MKLIDCSVSEAISQIVERDLKIIGFGTGKMAQEALAIPEIKKRMQFFVDNDCAKQNKGLAFRDFEFEIKSPAVLNEYSEPCAILICSTHFKAIGEQLDTIESHNDTLCINFPVARLRFVDGEEKFQKRVIDPCLSEYKRVLLRSGLSEEELEKKLEDKRAFIQGDSPDNRPLVLPRIMIMPTTICNLKCKDCSSLFPYFDNPAHLDVDTVIENLERVFHAVDGVIRITIGGEPFLYPKLSEVLEYLINQPKLSGILMISNSTILPKEPVLDLISNPKVEILLSDYGFIDKMSKMVATFEANNVNFTVLTDQEWIDMGKTHFRDKDENTRSIEYLNCEQPLLMKAIHDGKMFSCARAARMYALGAYESKNDYFELSDEDIREKITHFLYKEIADSCNYCDCGKMPTTMIPAGVQLDDSKKPHSSYTLVNREEFEELKRKAAYHEMYRS